MCSNAGCFGFVGVLQWLNLNGENMKKEGLTLNQLAESNAVLVTEVEKLRAERDQLAAENVALKSKGKELLGEACAVYSRLNKLIDPSIGDFVDGQTLHEFKFVLDVETPATDRIVAGIKADGVEEFAKHCDDSIGFIEPEDEELYTLMEEQAREFAKQLREVADK